MYPYLNEDAAWQRLKDLQREMENSRLMAEHGPAWLGRIAGEAAEFGWALWRGVRPRWWAAPVPVAEECDAAVDAA